MPIKNIAKNGARYDVLQGARVRFPVGGKKTLIDGPFAESKELVAGYWLIQVKSLEEAIEWGEAISVFAERFEPGDRNRSTRVY